MKIRNGHMKHILLRISRKHFSKGIFVVGLLMTIYVTFLNVDVYHEGDRFPSSVVLAQGGMIFRDVNNIYGFLPSLLIAPFVNIFGSYLLVSRIVGLLVKLCLVVVFVKLLERSFSKHVSICLGGVWLVITPAWSNLRELKFSNGFAWPTHYGILLVLLAVLVFPNSPSGKSRSNWRIFFSSLLLAAAWSSRLEFLATWLIWTFLFLAILYNKQASSSNLLYWIFGGGSYFGASMLWLSLNGSLQSWYIQTILAWFSDPPAQPKITPAWLFMNSLSFLIIASLGAIVLAIFYFRGIKRVSSYLMSVCLILSFIYIGPELRYIKLSQYKIGSWIFEMSNRGLLSYVNILFILGIFVSVIVVFNFFMKGNTRGIPDYILLLACTNISLLSMLHIVNADYLQMFIMPYALVLFWYVKTSSFISDLRYPKLYHSSIATISIFCLFATFGFLHSFSKPIYPYRSTILAGLYDQKLKDRDSIDSRMSVIADFSSDDIWTFCISGLPTVATGEYRSKDLWLWNLEPEPWMIKRWANVKKGDFLYVCSLLPGEQRILDRNLKIGNIVLVKAGEGFSIYQAEGSLT